ncbi:MAG: 4-hydroxythreonine-4-phosphate dehydrogenase PdxA [Caldilineaceae bacterium]
MTNATSAHRPLLAVTMGDPAGIGPEIVVKALLLHPDIYSWCRPLVVGDVRMLARAWVAPDRDVNFDMVTDPAMGRCAAGRHPPCWTGPALTPLRAPGSWPRRQSGRGGRLRDDTLCDLAMAGDVGAVVTAPLNKEAMHMAGFNFAAATPNCWPSAPAREGEHAAGRPTLRVVREHACVWPKPSARHAGTCGRVIDLAHRSCVALGIAAPRIAVAGLNPAGESGLFGTDEPERIQPAIDAARARGLDVSDPQPPDTVFLRAVKGAYDIVVAMYHDQGHIPMKLLAFDSGVNVSMGLPIIRTSVDHGTAFDIAGTGVAGEESLLAAMDVAVKMAGARGDA